MAAKLAAGLKWFVVGVIDSFMVMLLLMKAFFGSSLAREHRPSFGKLFKGWQTCRYFGRNLGRLDQGGQKVLLAVHKQLPIVGDCPYLPSFFSDVILIFSVKSARMHSYVETSSPRVTCRCVLSYLKQ